MKVIISTTVPFMVVQDNAEQKSESATTLYISAELLRISSCFLYPIMPSKTGDIIQALDNCPIEKYDHNTSFGVLKPNNKLINITNIFPRID